MNKSQLRKHFRAIRSNIPAAQRVDAANAAAAILTALPIFKSSQRIACYMAYKDELDLSPVIKAIWAAHKHCYLPILIHEIDKPSLQFLIYKEGDPLHPNRYGILEPDHSAQPITVKNLDIVLTPLIAFDRHGNRLGTGGGYYDRTFEAEINALPLMIGMAYAEQEAHALPVDNWDIRLDGVVTNKGYIPLRRQN